MQQAETKDVQPHAGGTQLVIAVFDDWNALHNVLVGMEANASVRAGTVLHARRDAPARAAQLGLLSELLKEMTELHFAQSHQRIACTVGPIAQRLSARLVGGARSIKEAVHGYLSPDQAWQLESHLVKGRLALCVELRSSDDYAVVCGRLVQASPHMVGLCSIKFEA
jgi:hypothetical protein